MSWEKVKLSTFLINRENRFKPRDRAISGLKRIDKIDFSGKIFLSDKPSNTDMILVKHGDLIISGINVEKGAMSVYQGTEDVTATIHYSSYIFNKNKINIDFLKMFLRSPEFKSALKAQVPGGIKTEIKPKHLLNLEVVIPNEVSEQQEIVDAFLNIQTQHKLFANELSHQQDLLKQLRQAFLREAMQGKLVKQNAADESASDLLKKIKEEKQKLINEKKIRQGKIQEAELQDSIMFEIPANWAWCKLDELCWNITDGTHQTPSYTKSGRIFLSAQNIKPFKFMPEKHKFVSEEDYNNYIRNRKAEKGDILVARVGAGIGEAAVIDKEIDFCFYVSLALVQPFTQFVDSEYLTYVFNSPYGVQYAKGNISSKGGSAGNFNLGRIRSFLVPLPPVQEQKRIIKKLKELTIFCDALQQSIEQSKIENEKFLLGALRDALKKEEAVIS